MSRETRVLQKRFAVFCEGDTEYNYIDKMRKNQGVELVLKPIHMHGGGYSNFLQVIKSGLRPTALLRIATVLLRKTDRWDAPFASLRQKNKKMAERY